MSYKCFRLECFIQNNVVEENLIKNFFANNNNILDNITEEKKITFSIRTNLLPSTIKQIYNPLVLEE